MCARESQRARAKKSKKKRASERGSERAYRQTEEGGGRERDLERYSKKKREVMQLVQGY